VKDIPSLRPTALELLDAVKDHLASRVIPAIQDPQLRFQTLVAAHVLGVVGRELSAGSAPFRYLREQRASLPGAPPDDAALCAMIDAGAFDDESAAEALRAHLTARTELALMAWNPLFVARVKGADAR
jgi:hypothetical protein